MRSFLLLGSLAILLAACVPACANEPEYFPPPDSAGGWMAPRDPAQALDVGGVAVRRLDQAFEYASRTSQHGGLLVARHGWLVYERYYGRGRREAIPATASVGKAFTSIACGIMLSAAR